MKIRVGIVEHDRPTLKLYEKALRAEADIEVVSVCESVERALQDLPITKPDTVLMDIRFPTGNGIECTRLLKKSIPETSIIMLTAVEDGDDAFAAILAGADGYILKSVGVVELVAAVREVARDGAPITPLIARKILGFVQRGATSSAEIESLSPRESEILGLIAQGCKNAEIAARLELSPDTVGNYTRRIYAKLHVQCRAHAVAKLGSSKKLLRSSE